MGAGTTSTSLVSPNGYFKLEISKDGNLQMKTTIYACNYTKNIAESKEFNSGDSTNFMYTPENSQSQAYYVYTDDKRLPDTNTPYYYSTNASGVKTLQPIAFDNPYLQNSNNYTAYPGFSSTTNDPLQNTISGISEDDCKKKCNSDPKCNYFYVENKNKCSMSKNNLPDFIPNNNSNLYVRKKHFYCRYVLFIYNNR